MNLGFPLSFTLNDCLGNPSLPKVRLYNLKSVYFKVLLKYFNLSRGNNLFDLGNYCNKVNFITALSFF